MNNTAEILGNDFEMSPEIRDLFIAAMRNDVSTPTLHKKDGENLTKGYER